jgi:hypothetical protein
LSRSGLYMNANGPAVELVAVCVAVPRFLPVLVDGRELSCHDETVKKVPSPGKDCEFWVTVK